MTMSYTYTPSIWPSFFIVLLMSILAVYSGRRRSVPGATPFMIACLFAAAWEVISLMKVAAIDMSSKIFWFKVQAVDQLPIVISITCFILEYAWPGRWLTRRNLALLSIPLLLYLGLIITNELHHLLWLSFVVRGTVLPLFGPGLWVFLGYFLLLTTINIAVLSWLFLHSPQHRWPVVIILAGMVAGRIILLLERNFILQSVLPLDIFGLAFEFLMYAIALFGFHILDPIPMARQTAIEQLQAGMLVLDPQGKIVSSNPAAQSILGSPTKRLQGCSIQDLLPSCPDLTAGETGETEISLGNEPGARHYLLETSALKDWRGLPVGRLLLLHDVSDQKKAQAQLLEQQRALATLRERERLARELHDSTGQVLGFAGFQLEAVHDRILDSQAAISAGQAAGAQTHLAEAGEQLTRLSSIVEEAHADIREFILNLRSAPSDQQPFFTVLQHYLDGFSQNYGIQAECSVGPEIDDGTFEPDTQMQLFRIIQEALSNARKHAEASHVQVSFELKGSLVRICIQDNGQGFDPAQAEGEDAAQVPGRHFGLRFMRERAEQIGGILRVDSAPGTGTRVVVEIPVESS